MRRVLLVWLPHKGESPATGLAMIETVTDGLAISLRYGTKNVPDSAPLWEELFAAEHARIVRLLVERVDLSSNGIEVRLRAEGLQTLVEELRRRKAA
jgi:hypothetical protein